MIDILSLKKKQIESISYVFSPIRKKWLVLTPEEEVRQKFIIFLVNEKKIPLALFQEEKEFMINNLYKRFDILIYNTKTQPHILVECKAHTLTLNHKNLQQILSYMQYLKTPYFIFVNNAQCRFFCNQKNDLLEMNTIPTFEELF